MYKLQNNSIKRLSDGAIIPIANGNMDYEEYKQWLSEGNTHEPEYTEEELLAKEALEAKQLAEQAKQLALDSITVTTTSGKVFDGRDKDQVRMLSAIQASTLLGLTESAWKLTDNSIALVSLDELKEAHALAIQTLGAIIVGGN